jgi:hypothetical protein
MDFGWQNYGFYCQGTNLIVTENFTIAQHLIKNENLKPNEPKNKKNSRKINFIRK